MDTKSNIDIILSGRFLEFKRSFKENWEQNGKDILNKTRFVVIWKIIIMLETRLETLCVLDEDYEGPMFAVISKNYPQSHNIYTYLRIVMAAILSHSSDKAN